MVSAVMLSFRQLTNMRRPIVWKVTSSTKPEVHNVLQRRQKRTEPQQIGDSHRKLGKVRPCGFWDVAEISRE